MRKAKLWILPAALLLLSGCLIPEEEEFKTVPIVQDVDGLSYVTSSCVRRDIVNSDVVHVTYVSTQTTTLTFEENDQSYDNFFVSVGDAVTEGQLLAKLDTERIDEEIRQTRLNIENAKTQTERLKEEEAIAKHRLEIQGNSMDYEDYLKAKDKLEKSYVRQYERLQDTVDLGELRLQELEEKLKKREIFAPFTGVITFVHEPNPDEKSQAGKKMLTIVDTENSMFRGETDFYKLFSPGDIVTIRMNSGSEVEAKNVDPSTLDISATEQKNIRENTVCFQSLEPNFELASGEKGSFTLDFERADDVLSVPVGAVTEIGGQMVAYIPDEKGIMTYKPVETGVTNGIHIEIRSGLEEGDTVIVNRK